MSGPATTAFILPDLETLALHLAQAAVVIAPTARSGGFHLLPWAPGQPLTLCREPNLLPWSAKSVFFAERETLFAFDGRRFVATQPTPKPQVLFGLTACDLTAVAYQDRFFEDDPHYQVRRAAALLVGVDCERACEHGFCPRMDAGPAVRSGTADLVLTSDKQNFLLSVASQRGHAAIEGLTARLAPVDGESQRAQQARAAEETFWESDYIPRGIERLNAGTVPSETWDSLGVRCIACSGCTSVCPTCSCFATTDEPSHHDADAIEHLRRWDSCQFAGFQREASGHHPSPTPGMRLERFYQHKFSNAFKKRFGRYTCVGCGRCEAACPGSIGVHSTLSTLGQP